MVAMSTLADGYRALVVDLDGVVYRGPEPIQPAVDALSALSSSGMSIAYATNNASRSPHEVAEHLRSFGLDVQPADVFTSSLAGAHHLSTLLPEGARVLPVGGEGVGIALREKGFEIAESADDAPAAVLQGYGPNVTAARLGEAAYAIERGAKWVATNTDRTLPTDRGVAPGNGTLVEAVAVATGVQPEVVGKPGPMLYTMAASTLQVPTVQTLGVGDRLDTDIEGASAAGMDSLFVLSGVHGPKDLAAAPREQRPRFICVDGSGLREPYEEPRAVGDGWGIATTAAALSDEEIQWSSQAPDDDVVALRIVLRVLWDALDDNRIDEGTAARLAAQYGRTQK
ncbi:HAD superfamily hydrolase (TIGR01450 family) [Branchiibius hedensis]|uniref:Haloacid Dehalogenase Superfamily Class (Subfamily) IIA n=2 Tax=Branchiibius hedensis TaxID=672460 RepID=A0A2Y8ZPD9_9MICO|nr:HAD superfamily hydrolase (TIGR01450 family) [Branchiibius hedensis]SSA34200.1 Haloacid Dehalogenase Superfamily Class (subfamily) IIA [Branchiibius hedensis]